MRRAIQSQSATGAGKAIPVAYNTQFQIGLAVIVTGTATYKIQYTFDDVFDLTVTPTWFDHPSITGLSTNISGNFAFPIAALRLNVTAYTSGTVTLTVLSASL